MALPHPYARQVKPLVRLVGLSALLILISLLAATQNVAAQSDPTIPFRPLFLPQVSGGSAQADVPGTGLESAVRRRRTGHLLKRQDGRMLGQRRLWRRQHLLSRRPAVQTLAGQQCLAAASGSAADATANDVSLAQTTSLNIIMAAPFPVTPPPSPSWRSSIRRHITLRHRRVDCAGRRRRTDGDVFGRATFRSAPIPPWTRP